MPKDQWRKANVRAKYGPIGPGAYRQREEEEDGNDWLESKESGKNASKRKSGKKTSKRKSRKPKWLINFFENNKEDFPDHNPGEIYVFHVSRWRGIHTK